MCALSRNFDLCNPRKETDWPQSQFQGSCVCERFIYSHDRSTCFPAAEYADGLGTYSIPHPFPPVVNWTTKTWPEKIGHESLIFFLNSTRLGFQYQYIWLRLNVPDYQVSDMKKLLVASAHLCWRHEGALSLFGFWCTLTACRCEAHLYVRIAVIG